MFTYSSAVIQVIKNPFSENNSKELFKNKLDVNKQVVVSHENKKKIKKKQSTCTTSS